MFKRGFVLLLFVVVACGDDRLAKQEAVCGDGVVQATESCDDGNTISGDGCESNCTVTLALPGCGNGIVEGTEQCDDGNTVNDDGCDMNCKLTACGNALVTSGEDCDDGNTTDGDGCDSNCKATACGNGVVTAGEGCDDGNLTDGDGCDSNCTLPACGNHIVDGTEQCDDGNTTNGDGCDNNCKTTACGNGVVTTGEVCDDGNAINGDGCDTNCMPSGCGNGIVGGTEACDDGNTTNGDGCDNNCTATGCGNGILTTGETCDDGNTANGDGCSATCHTECGDGVLEGTEACDDGNAINGDGCDTNCTLTACGNGIASSGEQCDDGNSVNGDGCSTGCRAEPNEIEPNEDGTPSTGGTTTTGNDFSVVNANANGAYDSALGEVHIRAAISPAGDEDVFAIKNSGASPSSVRFDVWNPAAGFGFGVACGTSIDTVLRIEDATGASLALNDDRNSAADRCSALAFTVAPGQTVYAYVIAYGDATAIAAYDLQIKFTPVVCGDGVVAGTETCDDGNAVNGDGCDNNCKVTACGNGIVTGAETCDDGNTVSGDGCDSNCKPTGCGNGVVTTGEQCDDGNVASSDGCSATCQSEVGTPEIEANDTTAQADANALQVTGNVDIRGSLSAATDIDTFKVTVATGTVVRFDTLTSLAPRDCVGGTTDMRVLDSTGTLIVQDTGSTGGGIGNCGGVVLYLAPGTYYAQVKNTVAVSLYYLQIEFATDAGSESEPANMSGVNDTVATASVNFGAGQSSFVFGDHTLNADSDVYTVTVPAGAKIRAEVIEGDRATETCESNGVDSELTLYDQTGAQLVTDDDDGRGFCSAIDGNGTVPLDAAAKNATATTQTYYLQVRQSHTITMADTGGQFTYRLSVTIH